MKTVFNVKLFVTWYKLMGLKLTDRKSLRPEWLPCKNDKVWRAGRRNKSDTWGTPHTRSTSPLTRPPHTANIGSVPGGSTGR